MVTNAFCVQPLAPCSVAEAVIPCARTTKRAKTILIFPENAPASYVAWHMARKGKNADGYYLGIPAHWGAAAASERWELPHLLVEWEGS